MLQIFQKYKKTMLGGLMTIIITMSMLSFGVNYYNKGNRQPYAMKINGTEVPVEEFYSRRRLMEQRLRGQEELQVNQTVLDELMTEVLLRDAAKQAGLAPNDYEVVKTLHTQLFPQGFSKDTYAAYLRSVGMTAPQFEQKLKDDLFRRQYVQILSHLTHVTDPEVLSVAKRNLTTYTLNYVKFTPSNLVNEVAVPNEEELRKFYEENSDDFQISSRASYDYVVLDPAIFPNLVEVQKEDVQLYYADHLSQFKTSDEVKARHILFNYPANATPEQKEEVKKKGERVLERLKKGDSFDELAKLYSEDFATKETGGDLGWFGKGKLKAEVEKAAFRLKSGRDAELVSTDYGVHVLKVEGFKPGSTRSLEEVTPEIEAILKKQELPAYLAAKLQQLYDEWTKGSEALRDFAVRHNLVASSTTGLLGDDQDPEEKLKGLTDQVLGSQGQKQLSVELPNLGVLVEVKEFKEPELPTLAASKEKVVQAYKERHAKEVAERKAKELLDKVKQSNRPLKEVATEEKVNVEEAKNVSRAAPNVALGRSILEATFALQTTPSLLPRTYEVEGSHLVAEVVEMKRPSEQELNEKLPFWREMVSMEQNQIFLASILNKLKAVADKDFDARLLQAR